MDIGATFNKGKHKGKGKGKHSNNKGYHSKGFKGKGFQQGKGYGSYISKGKGKAKQFIWQQPIDKGPNRKNKGKAKGAIKGKGKHPMQGCYRCGQYGHMARDCRVVVYNMSESRQE